MLRNLLVGIFVVVVALVIIVLGFLSINKNNASNIRNIVDKKQKYIAGLLEVNPIIVDFLENVIYNEDDVLVTYEKETIVFYINEKKANIDEEIKGTLTSIFQILNCERIRLYHDTSGKVLEIFLGDVTIDKENIYSHLLFYSTSKSKEYGKEILTNWYYEVLFYT